MSAREWKPGDVALVHNEHGVWNVAICTLRAGYSGWWWRYGVADTWSPVGVLDARPLAVIDPEDREQVERLLAKYHDWKWARERSEASIDDMQATLREFANPTPPEPTDPKAVVTDCRENTWRLLADGEWVCTSGPDIGEYASWSRVVERGPLEIEVPNA